MSNTSVSYVAGINVVAQAPSAFPVQNITETHLPQIVAALLVVPALRQFVASVGAGDIGVEVGGVVGQQAAAHAWLLLPQSQQAQLGVLQRIVTGRFLRQNLLESIPEGL